MNRILLFFLFLLACTCAASVDHDTPARHLPQAVRQHLPAPVWAAVQKLEFKDLDAAKRIAHAWPTIHSVRQLKQMLVEESPALKSVIDATIRSVHEQFDHAADQFDDETKQFVRQAGGIVAEAKNRLKAMWASASPNVKQHIRRVFPTTNSVIEHPHIQAVAVSYCGFLNGLLGGGGGGGGLGGGGFGNFGLGNGGGLNGGNINAVRLGRGFRQLFG